MIIKRLEATFGKLDGESLELHEGLNVISAPNESGKSTWCAFIRAMLYGIDSSERQKAGFLPDKMRYAPWSGAAMQGSMQLSDAGRDITLIRTTKTANAPMREFAAVYTGTSTPVAGLTGTNAGEALTGVSRDVFRRSAFVEQGKVAVTHSAELEKRISAIVSTGQEDCSFTEADDTLRRWQRKRRFNRYGRLPELEDEIARKRQRLNGQADAIGRQEQLARELESAKNECARLESEVMESRKSIRKEALSSLQSVRAEVNAASKVYDDATAECDKRRAELAASVIGEREPEQAKQEAERDIAEALERKACAGQKARPALAVVLLILCAALAAVGLLVPEYMLYALIAAGAMLVCGVLALVSLSKKKAAIAEAARQRRQLLSKYRAGDEAGISAALEEFTALYNEFTAAQLRHETAARALAEVKDRAEQTESYTLTQLDFSGGDSRAVQLGHELSRARARCEALSAQLSEGRGRLSAMGDPLVLGSELARLEGEHDAMTAEYDAIALAIETLRAANEDIQSRFSPALGKKTAEYMRFVTDGRYDAVMLDRDFSADVRSDGDSVPHDAQFLSAGTLDLLYLAVRLAVCELALPENALCPLIIDDALVNLDPARREKAIQLLETIAKQRQVILFTCDK